MYCIKCGVRLADTERSCPLCGTVCFHPDLPGPKQSRFIPKISIPNLRSAPPAS